MISGKIVRKHLPRQSRTSADPRGLIHGVLYVLTTGCIWHDVPYFSGTESTVHRYLLELCEKGVYQAIFLDFLRSGHEIRKVDLTHFSTNSKGFPAKRGIDQI